MIEKKQIEQFAQRLGAEAGDRVDAERTAWAVLARLRREGARVPWWRRRLLLPAAAVAATALLAVGLSRGWIAGGEGGTGVFEVPMETSLGELETDELAQILDSLEYEAPPAELVPAGLGDLSVSELEALLETMEG